MAAEAPAAAPEVSVVVCSRDRCTDLEVALRALDRQETRRRFEVVVVDDGSCDGTRQMLLGRWQPQARRERPRVALVNEEPEGPSAARNRGVRHARGRSLVFLDSDCVPEPGWLDALLAQLAEESIGIVGGAETPDPRGSALARAAHFALTSSLTTGRVRGGQGRRAGRYLPRTFSMAVRRGLFEQAGGFAEELSGGEDLDLSQRVTALGVASAFAPEARVAHRRRDSVSGLFRQAFAMGRARVELIRRDRAHAEPVYYSPVIALAIAASLVGVSLVSRPARPPAFGVAVLGAAYLLAVGVAAAASTRSLAVALLAPLVFVLQQTAYGLGFLAALAASRGESASARDS